MKKLAIAISALVVLISAPALAADLPLKAPPLPPLPTWSGWYVGIVGGGGWGRAEDTDGTGFDSGAFNVSGGLVGGTIGHNWQFNRVVLGLEGDGAWTNIQGSTTGTVAASGPCGGAPSNCNSNLQALGTFRGRAGYAWGNVLPFVTGGLAVGSLNGHEGTTLAAGAVGAGTAIVVGWTVGAGLEVKVTPQWSVKGEYLYVDLGNNFVFNDTLPALGGIVVGENVRFKTNIVRAGLDYHFVWGGLPIAR